MLEGVTPFPPEFARRYREQGYWEDRALGEVSAECFDRYAGRVAVVAGDEQVTYGELGDRVERLALNLLDLGVRPLDPVIVQLPNIPEFIYLYFALQRCGAIPLMALPPHRQAEIGQFAEITGAVGYAIAGRWGGFDFTALAHQVRERVPGLRLVLAAGEEVPDDCVWMTALLRDAPTRPPSDLDAIRIDPMDPCVFQLSGGTTGIPKVIPRLHNDYLYNTRAAAAVTDLRPDDALLVVLPMAHNFPLACPGIQAFLLAGARVVLSTSTQAADVFPLIERTGVTHIECVPALLIRWLHELPELAPDLSSVRVVNSGGQKLQPEVKRRTERLIRSCKVQEVFGMAEGLLLYARLDDPAEVRYQTVGRPVSPGDEVRLLDEDGNQVPPGEVGELAARGPYTFRGYFRAPEHNTRAFTPDGFYLSGDLLRLHPSGNYVVEGRKRDLVNRGGEKISTEEVENLLLGHPDVRNVACVPMPDPVLGERMCAYVVCAPGRTVTLAELAAFLTDRGIARFKLPERLELVDDLPLSPFGKVSKQDLTERIARRLQQEQAATAETP